ncbi:flagellar M-ring protein FliF [Rhizobiales bacterium TNE-4]|nr:flagellar M-ring protein FliF [Rhizobiales bacterium TNE-4]MBV1827836.1 flagellar M-ring protein FliF [Rhizobiales bacterium TNE-4]
MARIVQALQGVSRDRLVASGLVLIAVIAFIAFMVQNLTRTPMAVLYSQITADDAGAIIKELETRGIAYQWREDIGAITVPRDMVARLRLDLASRGIPAGSGVGYEIFDRGDGWSSTSFVQNVNQLRAMEGEIARSIRSLSPVQAARVHLAIPEKKLFRRDQDAPHASVVLKLRGELDAGQIRAIRHLTAAAVDGLKPERVSIVDERGRLLAATGDPAGQGIAASDERQAGYEKRLQARIEDIVASVVGQGRARVQVHAELDLNRVQQTQETFDPESRVVRSTQTRNETRSNEERDNAALGAAAQVPNGAQQQSGNGANREQSNKVEETTNYEISKTVRVETLESGRVKRLSVAVLVDGSYKKAPNGEINYEPRRQEELDRIAALVRSGVGFDTKRGDQIEVANLRFADLPAIPEPLTADRSAPLSFDDWFRMGQMVVLSLVILILLFTVVRPTLKAALSGGPAVRMIPASDVPQGAVEMVQAAPVQANGDAGLPEIPAVGTPMTRMIQAARQTGQVHARSMEQVGQLFSENPDGAITVLRQWINEPTDA